MAYEDPFNSNNTSNNFYNFNDQDPAAEFLEREKRELGDITGNDDVNSFNTNTNSLQNGIYHNFLILIN
jgi:hypothetical protein